MKKYNTPEIEALALETVDVIATSGHDAILESLGKDPEAGNVAKYNVDALSTTGWSW